MKTLNLFLILIFAGLIISCKNEQLSPAEVLAVAMVEDTVTVPIVDTHKDLYGLYTGAFNVIEDDNDYDDDFNYSEYYKKITLKINRIHNDSVYGHSIVTGNQRPFIGIFNEADKSFVLNEPGDNNSDGRFEVKIRNDSLIGTWLVYNSSKVKYPKKSLELKKKEFVYNPNFILNENDDLVDWLNPIEIIEKYIDEETGETESYPSEKYRSASEAIFNLNASTQKLTEEELKNLRKLDLEILKNSIYARHGYSFRRPTFRYFFENTDWYIPVYENVDDNLTDLEKENLEILLRFIKYAEDKYDSFGR